MCRKKYHDTYVFTTRTLYFLSIIACVLFLGNISCQKDPTGIESKQNPVTDPDYIPEGSWVTYSPYKWTHDGNPFFGDYCIAYSDCCSYQFKEQVVHFAEAKFEQVLNLHGGIDAWSRECDASVPRY